MKGASLERVLLLARIGLEKSVRLMPVEEMSANAAALAEVETVLSAVVEQEEKAKQERPS